MPRSFWQRWMEALKREFPNLTAVGELFDSDPALVSFFVGGAARFDGVDTKVDSLFDFPLLGAIRQAFARGSPCVDVAQVLARDHLYPDASKLTTFLGNHDMARFMNEPGATRGRPAARADVPAHDARHATAVLRRRDRPARRRRSRQPARHARRIPRRSARRVHGQPDARRRKRHLQHLRRCCTCAQELEPLRLGVFAAAVRRRPAVRLRAQLATASVVVAINNDVSPATWSTDARGHADRERCDARRSAGHAAARRRGGRLHHPHAAGALGGHPRGEMNRPPGRAALLVGTR